MAAEMISGSVLQRIARHAGADTLDELPAALPALTTMVLSSYLSADEVAEAVAGC
jgi:hypothetical protein